jgi:sulfate permease, SulP family
VTAEALADWLESRVDDEQGPRRAVVVDFAGVTFVDSQGSGQVGMLVELAAREVWSLRLARVRPSVRAVLDADGVTARLGADRVHHNVDEAVRAEQQVPLTPTPPS